MGARHTGHARSAAAQPPQVWWPHAKAVSLGRSRQMGQLWLSRSRASSAASVVASGPLPRPALLGGGAGGPKALDALGAALPAAHPAGADGAVEPPPAASLPTAPPPLSGWPHTAHASLAGALSNVQWTHRRWPGNGAAAAGRNTGTAAGGAYGDGTAAAARYGAAAAAAGGSSTSAAAVIRA